jgi:hypothetical protein
VFKVVFYEFVKINGIGETLSRLFIKIFSIFKSENFEFKLKNLEIVIMNKLSNIIGYFI